MKGIILFENRELKSIERIREKEKLQMKMKKGKENEQN
jgi:hypothetical protein